MAWSKESPLTSTWDTDENVVGGAYIDFVSSVGQLVRLTVDALGVLSTSLSPATTVPDAFLMEDSNGVKWKLDADINRALEPVLATADDNYGDIDPRLSGGTTVWDLVIGTDGVLETVSAN